MVDLKHSDIRIIDDAFQADPGYVLNFSDKTFREYFEDEFGIDIDNRKYQAKGTSKMNRLRTFCRIESPAIVSRVLRSLWEYREATFPDGPRFGEVKASLFDLLSRIEGGTAIARTDAIERFIVNQTLDELVAAIERDIMADRPVAALDRLHTYCAKKFGHLLDRRSIIWDRNEPLHSRVGKYVKALNQERELRKMTQQIIKNSIGVFDKFNHVRNNQSLAHDNEVLDKAEARFIFDSICAVLRFVKSIDTVRFDD
ncbi:MAG: abortive infection family protein [Thermodesulfobacteriota bacterium]